MREASGAEHIKGYKMDGGTIIYHVVDGEVVPKPGNYKDPNCRYRVVSNAKTGETKVIEFTAAQEAERDREEAEWERKRPEREAKAREEAEKQRKYRESLVYETRFVAFLDVLGWKEAIRKSEGDPEFVKQLGIGLSTFSSFVQSQNQMREHLTGEAPLGDLRVSQFSDCLLLSATPDHRGLDQLTSSVRHLTWSALQLGLLVRGAITIGDLVHTGSIAYGPGLIKAYQMESQEAIYPRVILDHAISAAVGRGSQIKNRKGQFIGFFKT